METQADRVIDGLGGTAAVAKMIKTPTSTVHSWRTNGIPEGRLDHIRLATREQKPEVDFDRLLMVPA